MNKKLFVILLALLVLAAGLLAAVHPLSRQMKKAEPTEEKVLEEASAQNVREEVGSMETEELPEETLSEEGLPLDTGAGTVSASASGTNAGTQEEAEPNIDPGTGMELEEDELPILTP